MAKTTLKTQNRETTISRSQVQKVMAEIAGADLLPSTTTRNPKAPKKSSAKKVAKDSSKK